MSRTAHTLWGGRHELTGPEGWRRVLHAYRRCEDHDNSDSDGVGGGGISGGGIGGGGGVHSGWPTVLFNQQTCGCWGAEVLPAGSPEVRALALVAMDRRKDDGTCNTHNFFFLI